MFIFINDINQRAKRPARIALRRYGNMLQMRPSAGGESRKRIHFICYLILISSAVVCGGMLAVIKAAWRTHTRMPGDSLEKSVGLPDLSNIGVFGGTLNLMVEAKLPSLMVVKLLFLLSIFIILPMAVFSGRGLPIICIIYAVACGGMLLVMAEEKEAFILMPALRFLKGIELPLLSRMMVLFDMTSLIVSDCL